jgi:N-methylhydantoinase B
MWRRAEQCPVRPPIPITSSVIQASLVAAADEMFAVLKKTAMSPIIYEVLDVGTGITDAVGNLVSSGAGIPTFVGVLDKAVKRIVEMHGADGIREGDMFVTNDPYFGGVTHLSDVVIALPVFASGRCVAWTASIAHWNDIGGATPGLDGGRRDGDLPGGSASAGREAVRTASRSRPSSTSSPPIPACPISSRAICGRRWRPAARPIPASGSCRDLRSGGLRGLAGSAVRRGRAARARGLASLPEGRYEIEEEQDDGAMWRAAITITPDRFSVDLSGNPEQRAAPFNTSRDGAVISAQMIFKALTDPTLFANAGSFRALEVLTEPGTIFHATGNAPHGYYFETRIRLYDMLWRCLARRCPNACRPAISPRSAAR